MGITSGDVGFLVVAVMFLGFGILEVFNIRLADRLQKEEGWRVKGGSFFGKINLIVGSLMLIGWLAVRILPLVIQKSR